MCLFCKIINGEIPSSKIYEDDKILIFKDITPISSIHYLAIPKLHISCAAEITVENSYLVSHIFEVVATLAKDYPISDGFRIVSNCGEKAEQTVKHLHFHILAGDGIPSMSNLNLKV